MDFVPHRIDGAGRLVAQLRRQRHFGWMYSTGSIMR
jgi:hypothetical protein